MPEQPQEKSKIPDLPVGLDRHRSREEITFAEFPVTTMSPKPSKVTSRKIREVIGADETGMAIYREWEMLGTEKYGLPIAGDEEIFVGLIKMMEHFNFKRQRIPCTRYQLCKLIGIEPSRGRYQRIEAAFKRFTTTNFITDKIFREPKTGAFVKVEAFSIIAAFKFYDRTPAGYISPDTQQELPLSYFDVSETFLEKLEEARLKPLDLDYWRALPKPLTKRLYRFLDKNRYRKTRYEIGLVKLAGRLGLSESNPVRELKRLLKPSLKTLEEREFLNDWRFEKAARGGQKMIVHFNPTYARNTHKKNQRPSEPHLEAENAAQSQNRAQESYQNDWADDLVRHFRRAAGQPTKGLVSRLDRERALSLLHQLDQDLALARFAIDYAMAEATRRALLPVSSFNFCLQNNIPERARKQYQSQEKDRVRRQEETDRRTADQERDETERAALDAAWTALTEAERQERIQAAQDALIKREPKSKTWPAKTLRTTAEHSARGRLQKEIGGRNATSEP